MTSVQLTPNIHIEPLVDEIEALLENADLFFGHSTTSAWEEAAWLVLYATDQDIGQEEFDWDVVPSKVQLAQISELIKQRIETQKPLAYLIKEAWFAGHRFYVDERAIVPRSYFGEWIPEQFAPWVDANKVKRALDLCTGSGCIAVALAYAFEEADVDATELSADAVAVAQMNVERHGLENRVRVFEGDLFGDVEGKYDLICSNPPYISNDRMEILPAEYLREPDMAFRGGDLGLDIVDRLLRQAPDYLTDEGVLIVEVGTAALDLEDQYPNHQFTWLSTDDEAMALFLISGSDLRQANQSLSE
ncbi:MAG: ribosomal protein L3 glutamine methyltransferase [Saprospiraceae bacterium]|jgi:ribosomal protein L3 glutamine methyltransferase